MTLNYEIKQQLQRYNYDCGHTCLDMLGFDGHNMFNGREMTSEDMRSLPGTMEVTVPVGQEETIDYRIPHVWAILPKPEFAAGTSAHFVIRHRDNIYCPSVGIVDSNEYKQNYVAFVLQEFLVPPKLSK